jgi:hypothetical protein
MQFVKEFGAIIVLKVSKMAAFRVLSNDQHKKRKRKKKKQKLEENKMLNKGSTSHICCVLLVFPTIVYY